MKPPDTTFFCQLGGEHVTHQLWDSQEELYREIFRKDSLLSD